MFNGTKDDDSGLIEGCIKRDAAAWNALIEKYSGLIRVSIRKRLKKYGFDPSPEEVEDIFQEVVTSIWERDKLRHVTNRNCVAYWIAIVSGNEAVEHMRGKMARGDLKFVPVGDFSEIESSSCVIDTRNSVRDTAGSNEFIEIFERHLELLPEKEGLMLKLHLLHGMRHYEISDMLKVPIGTVSSYLKRGKARMRKYLRKYR